MTTTAREAADRYRVTADTVCHWCRMGAVKATKQAGRWIIDTLSHPSRTVGIRDQAGPHHPQNAKSAT